MKNFVLGVFVSAILFAALALSTFGKYFSSGVPMLAGSTETTLEKLPTPEQIQKELVRRGYKINIDGVIGRETLDAWERACIDDIMTSPKFTRTVSTNGK
jgi:hypothetical protein